jgi:hypothetical protein
MGESRIRWIANALRDRGVDAHLAHVGVDQSGVHVTLPDGREAMWDSDGSASPETQVMRDGVLVGFVLVIEGSEDFDESQVSDAIARLTTSSRSHTSIAPLRHLVRRCRPKAVSFDVSSTVFGINSNRALSSSPGRAGAVSI